MCGEGVCAVNDICGFDVSSGSFEHEGVISVARG